MATSYRTQANTGADALVTSRSFSKPGTVVADDVGVFCLARWHESSSFPAVTKPTNAVLRATATGTNIQTLWYLHRVSAESSFAYSWTSSRWATLGAVFVAGVDPDLDLATVPFHTLSGNGTSITTLSVTTVLDAFLTFHINTLSGGSAHTPPTSFTEVADVNAFTMAYRVSPGSGSQSAASASLASSTDWCAGLVALAPASSVTLRDLTKGTESNSAKTFHLVKYFSANDASATEAAESLHSIKSADLAVASAEDAAAGLDANKRFALAAAIDEASAQPIIAGRLLVVGTAATEDISQGIVAGHRYSLAAATEETVGDPTTAQKRGTLGAAGTQENALPVVTAMGVTIQQGSTTDAGNPLVVDKAAGLAAASTDENARSLTANKQFNLGAAVEESGGQSLRGAKTTGAGTATEHNASQTVTYVGNVILTGASTEDTATALSASKTAELVNPITQDHARGVAVRKLLTTVDGVVSEIGLSIQTSKRAILGAASEVCEAGNLPFNVTGRELLSSGVVEQARALTVRKQRPADLLVASISAMTLVSSTTSVPSEANVLTLVPTVTLVPSISGSTLTP